MGVPVNRTRRSWVTLLLGGAAVGAVTRLSAVVGDERGTGSAQAREQSLVELGRRLFFDPRVSRVGARSCASCHDPEHGYSDPAVRSDDELGATRRHSQTLLDMWRNPSAHWDGEFSSVERLVLARIGALPGGSHGGSSELLTAAERRERVREGRRRSSASGGPSVGGRRPQAEGGGEGGAEGGTSGTAGEANGGATDGDATEAPPAEKAKSSSGGSAQAPVGTPTVAPRASGAGTPPASGAKEAEPEEKFTPAPKDNPAYRGRFANPTGAVGNGLRKRKDAAGDSAAPAPAEPPATTPGESDAAEPAAAPKMSDEAEPAATPAPEEGGTDAEGPSSLPPAGETREKQAATDDDASKRVDPRVIDRLVSLLVPVSRELERNGRYGAAFHAAFGSETVNDQRIADAIGAYVRSIRSTDSAYDAFVGHDGAAAFEGPAGRRAVLSPLALQGLALFRGRAGCAQCHSLAGGPRGEERAPFSDYGFHNTGIAWKGLDAGTAANLRAAERAADAGRAGVSTRPSEQRAFKTPTLRDVALRAPYMHDGSLATLRDVVRHYAKGGSHGPHGDPQQDARVQPFVASEQEIDALLAFLGSLSGAAIPGRATAGWTARAEESTLTFVDAHGRALQGIEVGLVPVGDALATRTVSDRALTLTTDGRGRVTFRPPADRTHVQIVLDGAFGGVEASWVPDTCREATVRVPVLGRVRLVLTLEPATEPPAQLVVEHDGVAVLPGQFLPRTLLERVGRVESAQGPAMLYAGWMRSDLPAAGRLRLAGTPGRARDLTLAPGETLYLDLRGEAGR